MKVLQKLCWLLVPCVFVACIAVVSLHDYAQATNSRLQIMKAGQPGDKDTKDKNLRQITEEQKKEIEAIRKKAKTVTMTSKKGKAIQAYFGNSEVAKIGGSAAALAARIAKGEVPVKTADAQTMTIDEGKEPRDVIPVVEQGKVVEILMLDQVVEDLVAFQNQGPEGTVIGPAILGELIRHEETGKPHIENLVDHSLPYYSAMLSNFVAQVVATAKGKRELKELNAQVRKQIVVDPQNVLAGLTFAGVQVVKSITDAKDVNSGVDLVITLDKATLKALAKSHKVFFAPITKDIKALQKRAFVNEAFILAGMAYSINNMNEDHKIDLLFEAYSAIKPGAFTKATFRQTLEKFLKGDDEKAIMDFALPVEEMKSVEVLRARLEQLMDVLGKL